MIISTGADAGNVAGNGLMTGLCAEASKLSLSDIELSGELTAEEFKNRAVSMVLPLSNVVADRHLDCDIDIKIIKPIYLNYSLYFLYRNIYAAEMKSILQTHYNMTSVDGLIYFYDIIIAGKILR